MKRYAIPGVFVGRSLTGVTRYSWEIIDQLDQLIAVSYTHLTLPTIA